MTKLLPAGIIYPIYESQWVSPIHVVPNKTDLTIVKNERDELIPTRVQNSWRVCIGYRRLNQATRKDHFPLLFVDQMLERLTGKSHYCFLDGFPGDFHIYIAPQDQEKTIYAMPLALGVAMWAGPTRLACLAPHFKCGLKFLTRLA